MIIKCTEELYQTGLDLGGLGTMVILYLCIHWFRLWDY